MTAYETTTARLFQQELGACALIQDLLPLYVEGEVSPGSRAMIMEHVARCEHCAGYLAGTIATDVGFVIANAHASRLREMLVTLNEQLTGNRLLRRFGSRVGLGSNFNLTATVLPDFGVMHGVASVAVVEHRQVGEDPVDAGNSGQRVAAALDDLRFTLLGQVLHHDIDVLRADGEVHRAADRRDRVGRAGRSVRRPPPGVPDRGEGRGGPPRPGQPPVRGQEHAELRLRRDHRAWLSGNEHARSRHGHRPAARHDRLQRRAKRVRSADRNALTHARVTGKNACPTKDDGRRKQLVFGEGPHPTLPRTGEG